MILDEAFNLLSPIILDKYNTYLDSHKLDIDLNLHTIYVDYTMGDCLYPRPILVLLGYMTNKDRFEVEYIDSLNNILFIPQLLRDFLAIHDDIVDEDVLKFNKPTLPVSFSQLFTHFPGGHNITKSGKDLALFYGDYIINLVYSAINTSNIDSESKISMISLVNKTLHLTQKGQIQELLLQNIEPNKISINDIIEMYKIKAAHYCYAFPFELGLIVINVPEEIKDKSRNILLNIGVASQIIDDITGVFPEILNQGKDTLMELIYLRRTIPLVLLSNKVKNNTILNAILQKEKCSEEEAYILKKEMIKNEILNESINIIDNLISNLGREIYSLSFSHEVTEYLQDLLNKRIVNNSNIIKEYLYENIENY